LNTNQFPVWGVPPSSWRLRGRGTICSSAGESLHGPAPEKRADAVAAIRNGPSRRNKKLKFHPFGNHSFTGGVNHTHQELKAR